MLGNRSIDLLTTWIDPSVPGESIPLGFKTNISIFQAVWASKYGWCETSATSSISMIQSSLGFSILIVLLLFITVGARQLKGTGGWLLYACLC